MDSPKHSSRRSPYICGQCRNRKVRCDAKRPCCGQCSRLKLRCSFAETGSPTPTSLLRHRVRHACLHCRARKARCSGDKPLCQRCMLKGLDCVYTDLDQPSSVIEVSPDITRVSGMVSLPTAALEDDRYPSTTAISEAIDCFFRHVHYIPVFSFLHQASIVERHRAGDLEAPLALALVGLTASMLDISEDLKQLSPQHIDMAEDLIIKDRDSPSVWKVQALILIIKYRAASRQFSAVFMLIAIAVRFATALRLNYEDHRMTFLAREECRRAMWSVYMIDTVLAGGYQDFTLCPEEILHIQLPSHDRNYKLDIPQITQDLHGTTARAAEPDLGSLALVIRMMSLRQKILQFTKRAAVSSPPGLEADIGSLQKELDRYVSQLPSAFHFTDKNARLHACATSLPAFVTVHMTLLGTHYILYRLFIKGLKEALSEAILSELDPDFILSCHQNCLQSVRRMIEIFRVLPSLTNQSPILDADMAVTVYQSVRMLLYLHHNLPETVSQSEVLDGVWVSQGFLSTLFFECEAAKFIRRDLAELVNRGGSRPITPDPDHQVMGTGRQDSGHSSTADRPPHILSRHSFIGQMTVPSKDRMQTRLSTRAALSSRSQTQTRSRASTSRNTLRRQDQISSIPLPSPQNSAELTTSGYNDEDAMNGSLFPSLPDLGLLQFEGDSSIWLPNSLFDTHDESLLQ